MPASPARRHLPVARWLFLLAMVVGSVLISLASRAYFDAEVDPPFVVERTPMQHEQLWRWALHLHVVSAALSLPACLLLLANWLQRQAPRVHRWLGRITGVLILLGLVPSGAILAFSAKGGAVVTLGFLLSGAIVCVAMVQGIRTARARHMIAHRWCMEHVVAQLSVAVTSRALLVLFDAAAVDPTTAYVVALWLPVLASAALVHWRAPRGVLLSLSPSATQGSRHEDPRAPHLFGARQRVVG